MERILLPAIHFFFNLCLIQSQPNLNYVLKYNGYPGAVDIASPNDGTDRFFIVQKSGLINIIENGVAVATPFIDISSKIANSSGERGLLGLAFHPDYASNGQFFVNYTDSNNDTAIERYTVSSNPNVADPSSGAILLTITQPYSNHNGGDLNFSPIDNYLYIGTGDGGNGGDPQCYAQNGNSLLGKILRLDVDGSTPQTPNYSVPADNPYLSAVDTLDEIWAIGLRNPWRMAFDNNGDLWIADVGQNQREEVSLQPHTSTGGENYGWKVMEGNYCYDPDPIDTDCPNTIASCNDPSYEPPLFEYSHNASGGFSITGGFVYRGCKYPELQGYYLCTDYISKNTWAVLPNGTSYVMNPTPEQISSFGLHNNGEMYMATLSGNIYAIEETTHPTVLNLDASDSPFSGDYNAVDSIIISGVTAVRDNTTATFIAEHVSMIEEVYVPETSILVVKDGCN